MMIREGGEGRKTRGEEENEDKGIEGKKGRGRGYVMIRYEEKGKKEKEKGKRKKIKLREEKRRSPGGEEGE